MTCVAKIRRKIRVFVAAVLAASVAHLSHAETYPARPIRLIVPSAAGGSPDLLARLIAPRLGKILGQSVVVENSSGAAKIIGTQRVASAAPDRYTLLYGFNQIATMNPALYPKLSYQPERDLAPVSMTLNLSYVWISQPSFSAKTSLN